MQTDYSKRQGIDPNNTATRAASPRPCASGSRSTRSLFFLLVALQGVLVACSSTGLIDPAACPDRYVLVKTAVWTPLENLPGIPVDPELVSKITPEPTNPEERREFVRALLLDLETYVGHVALLRHQLVAFYAAAAAVPDPALLEPVIMDDLSELGINPDELLGGRGPAP